jgi:hypothetical protein
LGSLVTFEATVEEDEEEVEEVVVVVVFGVLVATCSGV